MRALRTMLCAWIALTLWSWAVPALAQSPQGDLDERAEQSFARGVDAVNAGDLALAKASFEESLASVRAPVTILNLALVESAMGQHARCLELLDLLAHALATEPDTDLASKAARLRTSAESKVAQVNLHVSPAESALTLDGRPLAHDVSTLWLMPGAHTLAASHRGYETRVLDLSVQANEKREVQIELSDRADAPPQAANLLPSGASAGLLEGPRSVTSPAPSRDAGLSKPLKRALWIGSALLVMGAGALTVALWPSDETQRPPRPPGIVTEI